MQTLTESQISQREDIFINFIDSILEEFYDFSDEYEMTEEDAYIASIVLEHFIENYKVPTLNDAIVESVSGYDVNQELYLEIIEALIDESVGSFVAGALHGVRNLSSKAALKRRQGQASRAVSGRSLAAQKYKAAAKQMHANKAKGTFSQAFHQGKTDTLKNKAEKAATAANRAAQEREYARSTHRSNVADTKKLAHKIDTGLSNVKNKITSTIKHGASRFGHAIGRIAGAFA
jgi:uncharacterized membrane protein